MALDRDEIYRNHPWSDLKAKGVAVPDKLVQREYSKEYSPPFDIPLRHTVENDQILIRRYNQEQQLEKYEGPDDHLQISKIDDNLYLERIVPSEVSYCLLTSANAPNTVIATQTMYFFGFSPRMPNGNYRPSWDLGGRWRFRMHRGQDEWHHYLGYRDWTKDSPVRTWFDNGAGSHGYMLSGVDDRIMTHMLDFWQWRWGKEMDLSNPRIHYAPLQMERKLLINEV